MTKPKIGKLYEYDRELDGVTMIAISSRGRTLIGRLLAAGAHLPTEHSVFGSFKSMAGFIRYVGGDRREHNREIRGIEYDDAVLDNFPVQYEEVIHNHFIQVVKSALRQTSGCEGPDSYLPLTLNTLPYFLYQDVDGELIPVKMPEWYLEALMRLTQRKPTRPESLGFKWDHTELTPPPTKQRTLKQLQAQFLRLTEGSDAEIDFWLTQEEFDSIPETVRNAMGTALKIQQRVDGQHIPALPKKIM